MALADAPAPTAGEADLAGPGAADIMLRYELNLWLARAKARADVLLTEHAAAVSDVLHIQAMIDAAESRLRGGKLQ